MYQYNNINVNIPPDIFIEDCAETKNSAEYKLRNIPWARLGLHPEFRAKCLDRKCTHILEVCVTSNLDKEQLPQLQSLAEKLLLDNFQEFKEQIFLYLISADKKHIARTSHLTFYAKHKTKASSLSCDNIVMTMSGNYLQLCIGFKDTVKNGCYMSAKAYKCADFIINHIRLRYSIASAYYVNHMVEYDL